MKTRLQKDGAYASWAEGPETEASKGGAAKKGEGSGSVFIFQAVSRLFAVLTVIFSNLLKLQMLRGSLWRRCCKRAKEVNAPREREAASCWPSNVYKPPPLHLSHSSSLPPPSKKESLGDKKHSGGETSARKCHGSRERLRSSTAQTRAAGVLTRDKMR